MCAFESSLQAVTHAVSGKRPPHYPKNRVNTDVSDQVAGHLVNQRGTFEGELRFRKS